MDVLSQNLKTLRTERFLTQKQVSEGTGLLLRTLWRWEAGKGEPGASELLVLARFFKIGVDQILGNPSARVDGEAKALPKVADLSGADLDYWIAKSKGLPVEFVDGSPVLYEAGVGQQPVPRFSSDLSLAEPLMHSKSIHLYSLAAGSKFDGETKDSAGWVARCSGDPLACWGATVAEAGMRAWLSAEIGPHVLA